MDYTESNANPDPAQTAADLGILSLQVCIYRITLPASGIGGNLGLSLDLTKRVGIRRWDGKSIILHYLQLHLAMLILADTQIRFKTTSSFIGVLFISIALPVRS